MISDIGVVMTGIGLAGAVIVVHSVHTRNSVRSNLDSISLTKKGNIQNTSDAEWINNPVVTITKVSGPDYTIQDLLFHVGKEANYAFSVKLNSENNNIDTFIQSGQSKDFVIPVSKLDEYLTDVIKTHNLKGKVYMTVVTNIGKNILVKTGQTALDYYDNSETKTTVEQNNHEMDVNKEKEENKPSVDCISDENLTEHEYITKCLATRKINSTKKSIWDILWAALATLGEGIINFFKMVYFYTTMTETEYEGIKKRHLPKKNILVLLCRIIEIAIELFGVFCLYMGMSVSNNSFTMFLLDILVLIVWIICSSVVAMISQIVILNIRKASNRTIDVLFSVIVFIVVYVIGIISGFVFFHQLKVGLN